MNLFLKIINGDGLVKAQTSGKDSVTLVYEQTYFRGDTITLSSRSHHQYLVVQLEDSMAPAFVYLAEETPYTLPIPFDEKKIPYSPKSFTGNIHLLTARHATAAEIAQYKNLAHNPYDYHGNHSLFPHCKANVETRGESVFAARNAIDGFTANQGHGPWPYQSWGINQQADAEIQVNFGRPVCIDWGEITTRADFPHDSWWTQGTLEFSDGSQVTIPLTNQVEPQKISFPPRLVTWVVLKDLIKGEDPSPFPALTQLAFWGTEE